jgi:hypothetical protein
MFETMKSKSIVGIGHSDLDIQISDLSTRSQSRIQSCALYSDKSPHSLGSPWIFFKA